MPKKGREVWHLASSPLRLSKALPPKYAIFSSQRILYFYYSIGKHLGLFHSTANSAATTLSVPQNSNFQNTGYTNKILRSNLKRSKDLVQDGPVQIKQVKDN